MELVVASGNQGKLREIRALAEPMGIEVLSAKEAGFDREVEETGATFHENALLKASTVAQALNLPALADDSGLVVDALDGAPGVRSARYAGEDATDELNSRKLMASMEGVAPEKRGAAFVCVMVVCRPDGKTLSAEGRFAGSIALEAAGNNGFGYDPVFLVPGRGLTMAQLEPQEKNAISHRGQALEKVMAGLKDFLAE